MKTLKKPPTQSPLRPSKIVPRGLLLLTLAPSLVAAAPLRPQVDGSLDPAGLYQSLGTSEEALQLACVLTCGRSCAHTDNC